MKSKIIQTIKTLFAFVNPRLLVSIEFYHTFGRWLNWKNPKDLNEKINWLKFNRDTTLWSLCADKYRVRKYVMDKGCGDALVDIYGVWYDANDIDFSKLPEQFVLKVNNGSGDVLICRNKKVLNENETKRQFSKLLKIKFSNVNVEPHYANMPPCVIAEELLDCKSQAIESSSLIDYKIWCFNGEPYCVFTCYNRTHSNVEVATYDLKWNRIDNVCIFTNHYVKAKKNLPKPISFDLMLEIARKLSQNIPQVRIDLYEVNNRPYFGEMTFTSAGGFMNYYTPQFLEEMGSKVVL